MRLEVESEAEDVGESLTGLLTEPGGAHGARSPEHCAKLAICVGGFCSWSKDERRDARIAVIHKSRASLRMSGMK